MTRKEAAARLEFEHLLIEESGKGSARRTAELLCRHSKTYARVQVNLCNGVEWDARFDTNESFARRRDAQQEYARKRDAQLEKRIRTLVAELGEGFSVVLGGDPRGCTVKLIVPSGKTNDFGREGICVPTA